MKKSVARASCRSLTLALVFCAISGLASAAEFPYVSCVGNEWRLLKPQLQADGGVCLRDGDVGICRGAVTNASNMTNKVAISKGGRLVAEWLEDGDPAYLLDIVALTSGRGELVVATLQSESQGMAMRDWNVAFVYPSGIGTSAVLHASTAEFGAEGSLVKPAHSSSKVCALLVAEWKSRKTKQGESLFLNGKLRWLSQAGFGSSAPLSAQVRFDQRVKKLREEGDIRIPLILFDARH